MVRVRRTVPISMSVCLAFSAAGAVSSSSQTAWGAQVIQCSDLPELVKTYSPRVQMEWTLYETRLGRHGSAREEMVEAKCRLREETGNMERSGDSDGASNYRTQAKVLEEAVEDIDKQIRLAKGSPSTVSLRGIEDTTIRTAQSLMGTYHSLRAEQGGALAEAELMQEKYEKAMRQVGLGMVSQAVTGEVGKVVTAATNKVQSLRDDMERARKELLVVTGYPGNFQIRIGMLLAPDQSHADGIALEVDKRRVLGNNYELRRQRGSSSGGTIREHHVRRRATKEGETTMYGQMDTLYQNILAGRIMWQSAVAAQAAQEVEWKVVSNKTDLDILSRQGHLEAGSSHLNGVAAKAQADVNFQQAMNMYD